MGGGVTRGRMERRMSEGMGRLWVNRVFSGSRIQVNEIMPQLWPDKRYWRPAVDPPPFSKSCI
jgi:hypothetical protein